MSRRAAKPVKWPVSMGHASTEEYAMKIIEGDFAPPKGRFAIVAGRFNGFVVEPLVEQLRRKLGDRDRFFGDEDRIR